MSFITGTIVHWLQSNRIQGGSLNIILNEPNNFRDI